MTNPQSVSLDRASGELWAITSYFNPMGYERRLANYKAFREHLNVPLVAVELAYGSKFELNENDAEILIQLRGEDILWQKERLLNQALEALPSSCRKVAWLDCDLVFETDDWAERTRLLLDRFALVQPFTHVHLLPNDCQGDRRAMRSRLKRAVPFLIASGMPASTCLSGWSWIGGVHCSVGFAWAAIRDLLEEHRLYDACIIGGGDGALTRAAYGRFGDTVRLYRMEGRAQQHYLRWAGAFHAAVRGHVGFVEGDVLHLWHGDIERRRYRERVEGLARFQFDPFEDIAVDDNGAWRWNSGKREMHDYVRGYFQARREDG